MGARSGTATRAAIGLAALLLAGLTGACGEREPAARTTLGAGGSALAEALPPELQLHLDSGNARYRERDYDGALQHFSDAIALDPQLAAGWYGVGMTYQALGDTAATQTAMAEVHRLAPGLPLQHPVAAAPPNPHPVSSP